jgi:hypothetical protein
VSTVDVEPDYRRIADLLRQGRVVPFLGAGVNAVGRDGQASDGRRLPTGKELAQILARRFYYDGPDQDLVRVSQYLAVLEGQGALYDELREVFDYDFPPTDLHYFLAELPGILRREGNERYQLIVTTNYDDTLERAFAERKEALDVVTYIAEGEDRGRFLHRDPEGKETVVKLPNRYDRLSLDKRTIVVKIHGAVHRTVPERDSYVITEDHYIEYLTRSDISSLVPVGLASKIQRSHFLFLGYSLQDWNLRVILHRIWGAQTLPYNSWAVQLHPEPLERQSWMQRSVEIIDARIEDYIAGVRAALQRSSAEVAP